MHEYICGPIYATVPIDPPIVAKLDGIKRTVANHADGTMSGLQIKGAKRRRVQVVVGTEIARHPVVVRPLARCDAASICSERAGPSRVACMHHGPPRRGRRAWRWKRGRPTHTPTDLQPCWLGGGKEAVATCATRTAVSRGLTCGPPARLKAADAGRSPARQTSLLPPPHLNSKLEFWLYKCTDFKICGGAAASSKILMWALLEGSKIWALLPADL